MEAGIRHFRLNSGGGDAFAGHAIYGLLAASQEAVTIEVLGVAASAASIVAMAGRPLRMAENAILMLHPSSTAVYGTAADLRASVQMLDAVDDAMVGVYATRAGVSESAAREWVISTTWFSAQEALAAHLCDEVFEPSDVIRAEVRGVDIPDRLRTPEVCGTEQNTCEVHVMKLLLEKLGLAETATEAEAIAALEGILAAQAVTQTAQSEAQVAALHTATVQAAVTQAITDGKVPPALRDQAIAACGATAAQLSAAVAYWQRSPKLAQASVVVGSAPADNVRKLTPAQAKMARAAGVSDEAFLTARYGEVR
jgi:ClpP class serine protease